MAFVQTVISISGSVDSFRTASQRCGDEKVLGSRASSFLKAAAFSKTSFTNAARFGFAVKAEKSSLPLLPFVPKTTNTRVTPLFDLTSEKGKISSTEFKSSPQDIGDTIWAAYRQIFSEHQLLKYTKQPFLESSLRLGEITTKDFIIGLVSSAEFRELNYDVMSNYRFVELLIQRVLGREAYSDQEKVAWSIVLANEGITALVKALTNSDEYMSTFGDFLVPYQRARVLAGRVTGETRFNLKTPRYDAYYRKKYGFPKTGLVPKTIKPPTGMAEGDPRKLIGAVKGLKIEYQPFVIPTIPLDYMSKVPKK